MLIALMQLVGIVIPLIGAVALLQMRQQSESTIRLMLASFGCMVMNSGALLMAVAQTEAGAAMALKFQYLGNALFFSFFIAFLLAYLHIRIPKAVGWGWAAFECIVVGIYWMDALQERFIGHFNYVRDNVFHVFRAETVHSPLFLVRYSVFAFLLTIGMIIVTVRLIRSKIKTERYNLSRLDGTQCIMLVSLVIQMLVQPRFDFVPILSSLSLVSLVISMLTDGFFGVMDSGHEWVFEQMDNAYILVNSRYAYVDANRSAKKLFPELENVRPGMEIPVQPHKILSANVEQYELAGKIYSRKVTEIRDRSGIAGYGLLLEDITAQRQSAALLSDYNNRLQDEVRAKTEHIHIVQNSIITGMASVIESRDNSTGGHINRTSLVVRIFAQHLKPYAEKKHLSPRFLHDVTKAAPMHDIGKIAVDDVILRKPDRFSDEEYEIMKSHAPQGAKMLEKILREVDDEEFKQIAINVAHYHHERWDGKGYPDHISGEEIPLEARIMALADVFDALVSKRCYKEPFTYDRAFEIIGSSLGTQFDPELGSIFLGCREELEALYTELRDTF